MCMNSHCVLVGTDGSWHSGPLLDAAAAEASRRGLPLVIVSVLRYGHQDRDTSEAPTDDDRSRELTDWRLREAESRVRGTHPALEITTYRLPHAPLPWQIDGEVPEPDLLVVGARGPQGQRAFETGTVSRELLHATGCPVLVVPDSAHARRVNPETHVDAVVVGVADDAFSGAVLRAAAHEAAGRGAHLHVVHCYAATPSESDGDALARATARADELVGAVITEARWDAVPHSVAVIDEPPAEALNRRSAGASLLVVGARPESLADPTAAPVSRAVLDGARCPVLLVVPTPRSTSARLDPSDPPSRGADQITT